MCLYLRAVSRYQERQQFRWLQPVVPLWDLLPSLCVALAQESQFLQGGTQTLGPSPQLPRGCYCPHGIKTLVSVALWEKPFLEDSECDVQNTGHALLVQDSLGLGPRRVMRARDNLPGTEAEGEASGLSFPGRDGRQEPDTGTFVGLILHVVFPHLFFYVCERLTSIRALCAYIVFRGQRRA